MTKKLNAKKLAKGNPRVDLKQVRKADALLDTLRKQGLERPGYNLSHPYERRPVRSNEEQSHTAPRLGG